LNAPAHILENLIRYADPTGLTARYLNAVSDPAYDSAFGKMLSRPLDARLRFSAAETEAVRTVSQVMEERALAEGTGSAVANCRERQALVGEAAYPTREIRVGHPGQGYELPMRRSASRLRVKCRACSRWFASRPAPLGSATPQATTPAHADPTSAADDRRIDHERSLLARRATRAPRPR
jgi:hypothetical protein